MSINLKNIELLENDINVTLSGYYDEVAAQLIEKKIELLHSLYHIEILKKQLKEDSHFGSGLARLGYAINGSVVDDNN